MAVGRVIRFDGTRGYGFIAPDRGGDDVFLHVNDLLIPESSVHSGLAVEFEVEDGERGPKASEVRLAREAGSPPVRALVPGQRTSPAQASTATGSPAPDGEEKTCDVLGATEYGAELTELLLGCVPELTGRQIVAVREGLVQFGKRQGWVGG
ncbi:cold-shock protein [Streptomyces sp. NBC_00448]|uniref:cold-shock protein n=1 Tax=Streptomyces sp. NBC_00448 TaxID=2903652 RepID=UPI002E1B267C